MRVWLFHPLIFYPLALLLAGLVITVSLKPQNFPRAPSAAAAEIADGALVYTGERFDAPEPGTGQFVTVTRDFWGKARTLRIAIEPGHVAPTPAEHGVRLLLTPADAARLNGHAATVEVTYNPLPVNAAHGLAVSLQGEGPTTWVSRDIAPQRSITRFEIPAQASVTALGLRALNQDAEEAFGLEITRIRITPHTSAAAPN